jgi:hypothetical protein
VPAVRLTSLLAQRYVISGARRHPDVLECRRDHPRRPGPDGKGAALGTVLAFMMSVIALSLPEIIILKRVLKWQLIGAFIGVVGVGIVLVGYLFNAVI